MTLLQLKCFLGFAGMRRMSDTAAVYKLSPSTLSKQMERLQDELNVRLFDKTGSGVALSQEGQLIFPGVEYIVKQYDELYAEMSRYSDGERPALRIVIAFHQQRIMRALFEFMSSEPGIKLEITEAPAASVRAMLDSERADAGIIYRELLDKKYPNEVTIGKDRLVAVVSAAHPLAGRESVSVRELADETFYFFRGDRLMYQHQLRLCISAGFVPREERSDYRVRTILQHVAHGGGVSLLAENAVGAVSNSGVSVLHLEENPVFTMCAFFPKAYLPAMSEKLAKFLTSGGAFQE
ncbi:MAG: LysR family transcriptional regulator [Oscillospiraceae bacterium]|jgi:DNA-binding transcriptional LysR family regulator|nr:LysR family transcriptional regulator [Oscillospiraceae bacterium]